MRPSQSTAACVRSTSRSRCSSRRKARSSQCCRRCRAPLKPPARARLLAHQPQHASSDLCGSPALLGGQLARSLDLSAADVGILTSATALARLICNYPASLFAERVGRRPLLIAGPAVSAVGMCVLGGSTSFAQLAAGNACIGVGMARRPCTSRPYTGALHLPGPRHLPCSLPP